MYKRQNTTTSNKASNQFDHKDAIQERYGSAALEKESCLCTPVGFNPVLLEPIPQEVIERDYGVVIQQNMFKKMI